MDISTTGSMLSASTQDTIVPSNRIHRHHRLHREHRRHRKTDRHDSLARHLQQRSHAICRHSSILAEDGVSSRINGTLDRSDPQHRQDQHRQQKQPSGRGHLVDVVSQGSRSQRILNRLLSLDMCACRSTPLDVVDDKCQDLGTSGIVGNTVRIDRVHNGPCVSGGNCRAMADSQGRAGKDCDSFKQHVTDAETSQYSVQTVATASTDTSTGSSDANTSHELSSLKKDEYEYEDEEWVCDYPYNDSPLYIETRNPCQHSSRPSPKKRCGDSERSSPAASKAFGGRHATGIRFIAFSDDLEVIGERSGTDDGTEDPNDVKEDSDDVAQQTAKKKDQQSQDGASDARLDAEKREACSESPLSVNGSNDCESPGRHRHRHDVVVLMPMVEADVSDAAVSPVGARDGTGIFQAKPGSETVRTKHPMPVLHKNPARSFATTATIETLSTTSAHSRSFDDGHEDFHFHESPDGTVDYDIDAAVRLSNSNSWNCKRGADEDDDSSEYDIHFDTSTQRYDGLDGYGDVEEDDGNAASLSIARIGTCPSFDDEEGNGNEEHDGSDSGLADRNRNGFVRSSVRSLSFDHAVLRPRIGGGSGSCKRRMDDDSLWQHASRRRPDTLHMVLTPIASPPNLEQAFSRGAVAPDEDEDGSNGEGNGDLYRREVQSPAPSSPYHCSIFRPKAVHASPGWKMQHRSMSEGAVGGPMDLFRRYGCMNDNNRSVRYDDMLTMPSLIDSDDGEVGDVKKPAKSDSDGAGDSIVTMEVDEEARRKERFPGLVRMYPMHYISDAGDSDPAVAV